MVPVTVEKRVNGDVGVLGEWLSAIEIRAILERREMMERRINNLTEPRASQSARAPV